MGREELSGSRATWKNDGVEAAHRLAPRQVIYGGLRQTERFDLRDKEIWAGYSHPLSSTWTAVLEASHSPDHNVLPKASVLGQLAWEAGGGWVLSGGWRHSRYARSDTDLLIAGVEKYSGNWRASYTLYNGRPEGAGSGAAHRLGLDYYYGEGSRIGVGYTTGREVENVGPPVGVTSADVKALGLSGRHWLGASWALTYELTTHEQGSLYRRQGLRLGLRHRF